MANTIKERVFSKAVRFYKIAEREYKNSNQEKGSSFYKMFLDQIAVIAEYENIEVYRAEALKSIIVMCIDLDKEDMIEELLEKVADIKIEPKEQEVAD